MLFEIIDIVLPNFLLVGFWFSANVVERHQIANLLFKLLELASNIKTHACKI